MKIIRIADDGAKLLLYNKRDECIYSYESLHSFRKLYVHRSKKTQKQYFYLKKELSVNSELNKDKPTELRFELILLTREEAIDFLKTQLKDDVSKISDD